jgi:hypothetical protein
VTPGAEGAVAPSLAWKVCAVLPLVLLCVLMSVKVADSIGKDDAKESSQTQDPGLIPSDDLFTPSPLETPSESDAAKEREIMSGAPESSELPNEALPSETLAPDTGFEIPPGDIDQTATPPPTKNPTKKPTPSQTPSPSPTPTPDEAREQCIENGVSVLDITALAACIADLMDPNG